MLLNFTLRPNNFRKLTLSVIILGSIITSLGCSEIKPFDTGEEISFETEIIASKANLISLGFSRAEVIEILGDQDSDIVDSTGLKVCDAFRYEFAGKQKFLSIFYDAKARVVERQLGYDLACIIF